MKGQLYQAFVSARFEKEAGWLSTMIKCSNEKIRKKYAGIKMPGPAIGHYIALFDSLPNIVDMGKKNSYIANSTINARNQAISKIHRFLYDNRKKIPSTFESKLFDSYDIPVHHKAQGLWKFIDFFNKENKQK